MEPRKEITVELSKYGMGDNYIKLCRPSRRQMRELKNATSKCSIVTADGATNILAGDVELLAILAYICEAPFRPTLEHFCNYLDRVDAIDRAYGEALMDELNAAIKEIDESVKDGPFAVSPNQESAKSE